MGPVRLGIVGYGIMGERLLRAAIAHDPEVIAIARVWDPSSRAMDRLADAFPQAPRAASTHELVAASDCVYIASPPATHLGHVRRVLERDRAVFCEKPLAVDIADASRLVEAADAEGARAAVNFPFVSSFAVDQIGGWIAQGAVGEPRAIRI
ncbi:MAG: Gfo/Idh/MocA family protein, partial [Microvirga sp.]